MNETVSVNTMVWPPSSCECNTHPRSVHSALPSLSVLHFGAKSSAHLTLFGPVTLVSISDLILNLYFFLFTFLIVGNMRIFKLNSPSVVA